MATLRDVGGFAKEAIQSGVGGFLSAKPASWWVGGWVSGYRVFGAAPFVVI